MTGITAVTGGTGFIGTHLVEGLRREGRPVRLLVRRKKRLSISEGGEAEIVWGDVRDTAAVAHLVQGADIVFHLAAQARAWARDLGDFDAINDRGTRNVLAAARACGVRRVVHVSTELVDDVTPDGTPYQRSKRAAEEAIAQHIAQGGDAVIVRPTRVYGPGPLNQANSVTRVIALYRRGLFRVRIADGGARANYVYVEDVVAGLLAAAQRGRSGTAYVLGGENLTLEQLLDLVAQFSGTRHTVLAIPRPLAQLAAGLCELGGWLGIEPMITRAWVDLLSRDRPMSSALAEAELGYRPRSAREGIATTVAWLASQ